MEKKKKFNWKEFLKRRFMLLVIIGIALVIIWFAYLSPLINFDKIRAPKVLAKIPEGEIEYSGIVECSDYAKGEVPNKIICGPCFGVGKYEQKIRKTGECCYDLYNPEGKQIEPYQNIKLLTKIQKPSFESPYGPKQLFFEVKNVVVLKNVTPEDCKSRNYVSHCYYELAKKLNDINLCEMSPFKEKCITESAKIVKECEKVTLQYMREDCYVNLAIKSDNLNLCEKVEERVGWCKQEIYKNSARKLNDLNLCNKLEDKYSKEECISDIVTSVGDCEKMRDSTADCYRNLAKKLDDPNICDLIKEEDLKESCMVENVRNNIEFCEKIEKGYLKDKCIFIHARLVEDCYRIEDEQLNKTCLETHFKELIKVLNKETEYSGTLVYENGNLAICGNCFGMVQYEYTLIPKWSRKGKCCYLLDLSHYKESVGEENQNIKIRVIVRKPECEALKFDISSDRRCAVGCECKRLFFEVKEVIKNES